jgi:hypothetical protein
MHRAGIELSQAKVFAARQAIQARTGSHHENGGIAAVSIDEQAGRIGWYHGNIIQSLEVVFGGYSIMT